MSDPVVGTSKPVGGHRPDDAVGRVVDGTTRGVSAGCAGCIGVSVGGVGVDVSAGWTGIAIEGDGPLPVSVGATMLDPVDWVVGEAMFGVRCAAFPFVTSSWLASSCLSEGMSSPFEVRGRGFVC